MKCLNGRVSTIYKHLWVIIFRLQLVSMQTTKSVAVRSVCIMNLLYRVDNKFTYSWLRKLFYALQFHSLESFVHVLTVFVSKQLELYNHSTDLTDIIPFPFPKEQTLVELLVPSVIVAT